MDPNQVNLMRIVSDNEQDRSECERWWLESSPQEKLDVWLVIQREYKDPDMEIMARFAQLAFGEMAGKMGIRDNSSPS